jgi:2-oxoglutarate dehydrogenase E2 component (dihydrolipoamide succinyltransferase)
MKVEIKVPSAGESVVEATIGALLKPSGASVQADEEILELETDKVNQAVYAPAAGILSWSIKTGDRVKVGQTIGSIDTSGSPAQKAAPSIPIEPPKPTVKAEPPPISSKGARKKVDAALQEIQGAGLPLPSSPPKPAVSAPSLPKGKETRQKMSKLRRVIAERLVEVKNQTAMLTTFNELDMSSVMACREKEQESFQKRHGIKLGYMSFFIKASLAALQEFPEINARIEKEEIVYHHFFNMSIAVSTEKGLMVPVLRDIDQLSYAEIEKKLKEMAEKARSGTISVDDLQGGTFTITNAGQFGSLFSTPILNPPQSAILGMHNIVKRAVVIDDQIAIRPMMYLALSYDHRIVDGKTAVLFLMHIKKNLEEPTRLLLDL